MENLNALVQEISQATGTSTDRAWWFVAVPLIVIFFLALLLVRALLANRLHALAGAGRREWFQAGETLARRTHSWFLLLLAVSASFYLLLAPEAKSLETIKTAIIVGLLIQAALWGDALLAFAVRRYVRQNREVDAASVTTLSALGFLGRIVIWTSVVLLALANLGVNITAMVTGLGIGGVAVALAAQNILGDLFASVSIVLDKPFVLGDFIIVDNKMGSVEHIGLKTTRLHSLTGEQLIFSNADLLKSRIHNYKRMQDRRIVFTLGVTYDTPYEKLAAIPGIIRACVEAQQPVRFDRAHFARYDDSALTFEVVYYVLSADYSVYMDIQQAVNLALFARFAAEQISFAYPTRTIYLCQPSATSP